jgi:Capsule assembly protein Wzi/PAP2 superfamily
VNRRVGSGWWLRVMGFLAIATVALGQSTPTVAPISVDRVPRDILRPQAGGGDVAAAHDAPDAPQPNQAPADEAQNKVFTLPKALLHDQIGMWTSPSKVRLSDATWLVPLGGLTAAFLATDSDFSRHLSNNPNSLRQYRHLSDYGAYAMAGGAAGTYFMGLMTHNEHQRETGFLSGEAAIDSLIAVEALKFATGRQRPYQGTGNGQFWKSGSSFPSEHSAGAWAIAGIFAHEYPSPLMKFLAYGAASVVSVSRITAKQHFPSDVLIGAAIGYLTSEYVYRQHHNPELRGGTWQLPAIRPDRPSHWQAKYMGSPYVPLDSWVYPAMDRLIAMGYIDSSFLGMRPWTRMECARLVEESQDKLTDTNDESEASRLHRELLEELDAEVNRLGGGDNAELRLESVYTRSTGILGRPLTDGFNFGQTVINDYGRPYEQGYNNVTGLSGWAADGPFVGYVRTEFQEAPSPRALSDSVRLLVQRLDNFPSEPPATPIATRSEFDPVEAYVGMNIGNFQITYGKQAQWWGPDRGGATMFSNNAEPIRMLKIDSVSPFKLPGILKLMGPIRWEFFLGQLGGHYADYAATTGYIFGALLNPQPMILAQKFAFKPTPNVEFGFSYNTIFAGQGIPFTWNKFLHAIFPRPVSTVPGNPSYPGDAQTAFDLSYRFPWFGNGLTFYADGFADDEISPVAYWDRSAWVSGLYFPQVPGVPKLDFRVEGGYTDIPIGGIVGPGFVYSSSRFQNGQTNWRNLMGNWMGRAGQGAQAWSTYWFTPRNNLQFSFRHQKVSRQFVPNGGTLTDVGASANFWARSTFSIAAAVQYEVWNFPAIAPTRQTNVTSSLQLTFWAKGFSRKNSSE